MIVDRPTDTTVFSSISGDEARMGLDPNATAHLMSVLTDLYNDPETAVIREYSTNAIDAHIAAGVTRPIEVTLPSALHQFFSVRDYGVGLTRDDIFEIYSQYGASTKRNTNDFNGTLGLGCKAGLTYTSQFTVESVKDGRRIVVVVSRDEDGGNMTVIKPAVSHPEDPYAEPTDEPNGTKVTVPVKRYNEFESKAANLFKFGWAGKVLVNGKEPQQVSTFAISDTIHTTTELQKDYVVMGGVPYPVERGQIDHGLSWNYNIVCYVPIGDVNFTPSRESLRMTTRTKETLARLTEQFKSDALKAVQDAINACATPAEALNKMLEWHRMLPSNLRPVGGKYTYNGGDLPTSFEQKDMIKVPEYSSKLSGHDRVDYITAETWPTTIWFYGFEYENFTATMRKKINHYIGEMHNPFDGGHSQFVLTGARPRSPFIDPARVIPWETIDKIKLPRRVGARMGASGRIPGSYDMYTATGKHYGVPADDIDTDEPVFWNDRYYASKHEPYLRKFYPDCTVVILTENRIEKFKRNFPEAERTTTRIDSLAKKFKAAVKDSDKRNLAIQNARWAARVRLFDESRIDDPNLKAAIIETKNADASEFRDKLAAIQSVSYINIELPTVEDPLRRFTLLPNYYSSLPDMEHVYLYVNAVYAAEIAAQSTLRTAA